MNKAIAIINPSGLGGAEKRYLTLFTYFQEINEDIYLIINQGLLTLARKKGLLLASKNVLVIDLSYDSSLSELETLNSGLECKKARMHKFSKSETGDWRLRIRNFIGSYSSFIRSWMRWLEFRKKVIPLIKTNSIDTIYTVWLAGIWLQSLKKNLKLKLIHSYNDSGFNSISRSFLYYFKSEYWIIKKADHVDCLSNRLKVGLLKRISMLESENLLVSPCSFINYSSLYSGEKVNNIVFCSRLERIKNPLIFLEAIKLIHTEISSDWKILIIGTGSLEEEMRRFIEDNNLSSVYMSGYVSQPENFLRISKIFISIQQEDNYPSQALMEAMACENAIIASDVGDTDQLVDNKCGELIKIDIELIAAAIMKFIKNSVRLNEYGKSAREKVMSLHTIEKYSDYIRQTLLQ